MAISAQDAQVTIDNIKLWLAGFGRGLLTPREIENLHFAAERAEIQAEHERAEQFQEDIHRVKIATEEAKIETKRREFRDSSENASIIRDLIEPDYYDKAQLKQLDDLLLRDKAFCEKYGVNGSALEVEQLSAFSCTSQSEHTDQNALSAQLKQLNGTHRALVEKYAYIKFGERYTPEQLNEINRKSPEYMAAFIKEAEVYYEMRAKELETDHVMVCDPKTRKCHLQEFRAYSKDDNATQERVMENVPPKIEKELEENRRQKANDQKRQTQDNGVDATAKPIAQAKEALGDVKLADANDKKIEGVKPTSVSDIKSPGATVAAI